MCNAGREGGGGILAEENVWRRTLETNLWGAIHCLQLFLPDMMAANLPGAVILTGSKQGITLPPGDTAYKPYDPDSDKPATQIYVETTLGQIKELSTESRTVQQLREPYALLRYYFPESLRSKIDPIARATLNKGAKK